MCCLLRSRQPPHSPGALKDEQDFKGPPVPAVLFWTFIFVTVHLSNLINVLMIQQKHFTVDWSCCFSSYAKRGNRTHSSQQRPKCVILRRPQGSSGVPSRSHRFQLGFFSFLNQNSTHCTFLRNVSTLIFSHRFLGRANLDASFINLQIMEGVCRVDHKQFQLREPSSLHHLLHSYVHTDLFDKFISSVPVCCADTFSPASHSNNQSAGHHCMMDTTQ